MRKKTYNIKEPESTGGFLKPPKKKLQEKKLGCFIQKSYLKIFLLQAYLQLEPLIGKS